ncbi:MAG: ferredoxin family protein [Verrucomicrobiae bacterium]|nr:ferredoxin family protein [Verrucomicrobiae bacterium]
MEKLTVVLSQAPGHDPLKRELEAKILAALVHAPGIALSVVPHLYDLSDGHRALSSLRAVRGPLVVLAWLYPRAIHWTLHQLGVRGHVGETQLKRRAGADDAAPAGKPGSDATGLPPRMIWSLQLRESDTAEAHLREIRRIAAEVGVPLPKPRRAARSEQVGFRTGRPVETPPHRWYPVIDYSRCGNCLECVDFCLFGVFGVDDHQRLIVENPDNCKPGCPACARVCEKNAVMFPMHDQPAIAGAAGTGRVKIKLDLSQLLGASEALELAAAEKAAALERSGLGSSDGRKTKSRRPCVKKRKAKDELDKLVEKLDDANL